MSQQYNNNSRDSRRRTHGQMDGQAPMGSDAASMFFAHEYARIVSQPPTQRQRFASPDRQRNPDQPVQDGGYSGGYRGRSWRGRLQGRGSNSPARGRGRGSESPAQGRGRGSESPARGRGRGSESPAPTPFERALALQAAGQPPWVKSLASQHPTPADSKARYLTYGLRPDGTFDFEGLHAYEMSLIPPQPACYGHLTRHAGCQGGDHCTGYHCDEQDLLRKENICTDMLQGRVCSQRGHNRHRGQFHPLYCLPPDNGNSSIGTSVQITAPAQTTPALQQAGTQGSMPISLGTLSLERQLRSPVPAVDSFAHMSNDWTKDRTGNYHALYGVMELTRNSKHIEDLSNAFPGTTSVSALLYERLKLRLRVEASSPSILGKVYRGCPTMPQLPPSEESLLFGMPATNDQKAIAWPPEQDQLLHGYPYGPTAPYLGTYRPWAELLAQPDFFLDDGQVNLKYHRHLPYGPSYLQKQQMEAARGRCAEAQTALQALQTDAEQLQTDINSKEARRLALLNLIKPLHPGKDQSQLTPLQAESQTVIAAIKDGEQRLNNLRADARPFQETVNSILPFLTVPDIRMTDAVGSSS